MLYSLGWTIVHSIWQVTLIWLLLQLLNRTLFSKNDQWRYRLALLAMSLSAVALVGTFFTLLPIHKPDDITVWHNTESSIYAEQLWNHDAAPLSAASDDMLSLFRTWMSVHAIHIAWFWCVIASLLLLRLAMSYGQLRRLRAQAIPTQIYRALVHNLSQKIALATHVPILESCDVAQPVTIGFFKPVILFPIGLLARLSMTEVEALLLHELAHIRRYDYLINAGQLFLEACFFYHPLFWLMSREARILREYLCDDVVMRHFPQPILYARTLTNLQLALSNSLNLYAMTAIKKTAFTQRIQRIAGVNPTSSHQVNWLWPVLLFLFLLGFSRPVSADGAALTPPIPEFDLIIPTVTTPNRSTLTTALPPAPIAEIPPSSDSILPSTIAVDAVKMNILYIGVPNPLNIAVAGYESSELTPRLRTSSANIENMGNGQYNLKVTQPGELAIDIYTTRGGKEQLLGTRLMRVKRIPDPWPRLVIKNNELLNGGSISKEKLLQADGIQALLYNFDFDATCNIVEYEVHLINKEVYTFMCYGPQFSSTLQERIIELCQGPNIGSIYIDDIKVKCPGDTAPRNIGGITFKVNQ
jgi:beta-lactamase regulating signal transducer with metallopeptidase domain